ncbi:MAG: redox-sensing transcriptional repressor Rex [Oscillospiraceae bacterium]|nr:redox-sensing transcriptional repressor Rex [Bacteroidales bacterium]MDD6999412.1 redox-sensing transcriptional repressor Rex [Oscillospiraceae bacterium]MDY5095928.1 redox-sensing transcriptional repressor Rex [Oscillospiraceae bacterium]
MATQNKASLPVIKRLPKYYRYLTTMQRNGVEKVSSSELARIMGTTASQVRQDFNCFGGFGQQGIGYKVDTLQSEVSKLLFGDNGEKLSTILLGVGRLGNAVSSFLTRDVNGYRLLAAFDVREDVVGTEMNGVPVCHIRDLAEFCNANHPQVAVLCIPRESAAELSSTLVSLGIKGFWNFSHYDLSVDYSDIIVENVHLGDSLMSLGYRMRNE